MYNAAMLLPFISVSALRSRYSGAGYEPAQAMRIIILVILLMLNLPALAQDATATEIIVEADATPTANASTSRLDSPYLQDDLELLVGNVQRPNGLLWFQDSLFTVCNGDWTIYKIDDRTGDTITFVFGVRNGNSLIAQRTGNGFDIWVPDPDNATVWKVDQSRGAPARYISSIEAPWGILRLNDGRFLITDTESNSVIEVAASGVVRPVHEGLRSPTGIAGDGERVFIANGGSARRGIEYFELAEGGEYSEIKPLVSGLQNTTNIVMGSDGYLYFSYALGTRGVVGRVEPSLCLEAGCSNNDVEMVVFSDNPAPLAITMSDDLRLFLHSRFRPEIYWVQLPA